MNPKSRCPCDDRVSFMIQCAHEYCHENKFDINKYSRRWWNGRYYSKHNHDKLEHVDVHCDLNQTHETTTANSIDFYSHNTNKRDTNALYSSDGGCGAETDDNNGHINDMISKLMMMMLIV